MTDVIGPMPGEVLLVRENSHSFDREAKFTKIEIFQRIRKIVSPVLNEHKESGNG